MYRVCVGGSGIIGSCGPSGVDAGSSVKAASALN